MFRDQIHFYMYILTYKGTGSLVAMVQTTLPRMTLLWLTSAISSLNLHLLKSTDFPSGLV